jgi:hypothetical protein
LRFKYYESNQLDLWNPKRNTAQRVNALTWENHVPITVGTTAAPTVIVLRGIVAQDGC